MYTVLCMEFQKNSSDKQKPKEEWRLWDLHYGDIIMGTKASQITSLMIDYSTVYSGTDQRKHQSSASLAFVWGIHLWPVNSPHKWPVTRKMFPFDNVIMEIWDLFQPIGYIASALFIGAEPLETSNTLVLGDLSNINCAEWASYWGNWKKWLTHQQIVCLNIGFEIVLKIVGLKIKWWKNVLSWWHHLMETFPLSHCVRNSPVIGEFPTQRPVMQSFDVYFDLPLQ